MKIKIKYLSYSKDETYFNCYKWLNVNSIVGILLDANF